MPKIISIEVAKEKAIAKSFTQNAKTVEEVDERIDNFFKTVIELARELEKDE